MPGVGFDVVKQNHPLRLRLGVTSCEGGEDIDLAGDVEVVDAVWVNSRPAVSTILRVRSASLSAASRFTCQYNGTSTTAPGINSTRRPASRWARAIFARFSPQPMPRRLASMKLCVDGSQWVG